MRRDLKFDGPRGQDHLLGGDSPAPQPLRNGGLPDLVVGLEKLVDAVGEALLAPGDPDGSLQTVHNPSHNTLHGIRHHEKCSVNTTHHVRTANMDSPGDRIRRAREEMGLSQAQFGDLCGGWGQTRVSGYETGRNEPSLDDFGRMADVLGKPVPWLMALTDTSTNFLVRQNGGVPYGGSRMVPIIGNVIATPDTDGFFDDMGFPPGAGEGFVAWGTTNPHAYAVRVKGDSMYPRYRPGEILIIDPGAAVVPGEDVIVKTTDGRKMVKRLLFQRTSEIELGSINEAHRPITIDMERVESIQVVAGSVRRATKEP